MSKTNPTQNPFDKSDQDKHSIWEILVRKDIDAFINIDWEATYPDFIEEGFYGIDGKKTQNPDDWVLTFPNLETYKTEWLKQAKETRATTDPLHLRNSLFRASQLKIIDINGTKAVAHKEIKGDIPNLDGTKETLNWQTLYVLHKIKGAWKIISFIGYIPSDLGTNK